MLLEIRSSRPAVFFKNFVLQNLQVSQESICDGVFFRKAATVLRKYATDVFQ